MQTAPLNDTCPRCGGSFHCGAQDGHCDCFELKLTPELRESIAGQFDDCLCLRCLRELAQTPTDGLSG
ncbi:cysteine-rich CWC family protein [Burkholderiaceae bacterium UC74_6]